MTVQIEVLTGDQYEVDDSSGVVDLIEAINIQSSGPAEASRALRKKLYGALIIWSLVNYLMRPENTEISTDNYEHSPFLTF